MAVLDPRMLDLIETLVAARMDWLAFELIEGIQEGRAPTETSDTLAMTRTKVRDDDQPKATGELKLVSQAVQAIEGNDQIEWAAIYIAGRIDATLAYLAQSIENIDAIAGGNVKNPAAISVDASEPLVVLSDGETQREAGRAEVEGAIAALPQLRQSLEVWSAQMRGQAQV